MRVDADDIVTSAGCPVNPTTRTLAEWMQLLIDDRKDEEAAEDDAAGLAPPPPDCVRDALHYARALRWRVIPIYEVRDGACACRDGPGCQSPGKHPRIQGWPSQATTDESTIRGWWRRWPRANVGIATGGASGLLVLDVDAHGAADGADSLQRLQMRHGDLPPTAWVRTGGGGQHIYLRCDRPVRSRAGAFGDDYPGLDVRAGGGFVTAPFSVHRSGRMYLWEQTPTDETIADAPDWLPAAMAQAEAPRKQTGRAIPGRDGEPIPEGTRNDMLASIAGRMRLHGADEEVILHHLLEQNRARCDPPLPEREVEGIAQSVARYEPEPATPPPDEIAPLPEEDQGGQGEAAEDETPPEEEAPTPTVTLPWYAEHEEPVITPSIPPPFPTSLFRGLLEEYPAIHSSCSEAPASFHWAVAAAFLGLLFSRHGYLNYTYPHWPIIWPVLVGLSAATRKTSTLAAAERSFGPVDSEVQYLAGVGSGEALIRELRDKEAHTDRFRRVMLAHQEFSTLLRKQRAESSILRPILCQAFDCRRVQQRTVKDRVCCDDPRLGMIGLCTPGSLDSEMLESDVTSGFVNRILWVPGVAGAPVPFPPPVNAERVAALQEHVRALLNQPPRQEPTELSAEAMDTWRDFYTWIRERREAQSPENVELATRAEPYVLKTALLFSLLEGTPEISEDQLQAAIPLGDYMLRTADYLFIGVGATADARLEKRIYERLAAAGGPIKEWKLHQAISGRVSSDHYHRLLRGMADVGRIVLDEETKTVVLPATARERFLDGLDEP